MNRRRFFGFLAAAPIGLSLAAVRAGAATAPAKILVPDLPVGFIIDEIHYVAWEGSRCVPSLAQAAYPVVHRKIFDGKKFVEFDGSEGTAVLNRVLQRTGSACG